ncbi:hypothetical protein [Agrobacterium tumefaciens]|uniref:hypothetical protein n=1 Tax=Agrobacterium tumefaciens TaxID=358 RepID=UPI0021D33345|nr:hypothetical protein [Agrobacterium tumefaciens]UXS23083.1 hypothetical protein FY153_00945 [Agrobacterium tumefaciens]
MGTVWIREFVGGLDTRRMPVTTAGGVLVKASNGHITRGGEFEKRAAFVDELVLPAGTIGLAATRNSLYTFGSIDPPAMPSGVLYQRLQHPSGVALARVLSVDLYGGKLYVVGEFADGSTHHFYDGVRVAAWFDGRARASFEVTGGGVVPAVSASGSFEITGGTNGGGNNVANITIDSVSIIGGAVAHTGNNATTAAAVAAAINSFTSAPDYTATASGQTVTVTAATPGAAPNGKAIVVGVAGNVTAGNNQNMAGGANATTARLASLKVDGVSIINAPVSWSTSHEDTAAAIAAAINAFASAPDYEATAVGAQVNIIAADAGVAANGRPVLLTLENGLTVNPSTGLVLAGGATSDTTFQPGTFVKTIGQKVYSVSGPLTHFSGLNEPTKWTTDYVGAGFIDMSTEASGSEELVALAKYQNLVAVFAERVIQVWFFDPDPSLNRQTQVLNNTGTISPHSVTQFGDNDIFYLDESGLRSLKARDSSNAAATTDIGVPVDTLIVDKLADLSLLQRQDIVGLIEPRDGRFWLIMQDMIYVFSYFSGAKVSAWSTYTPTDEEGTPFAIEAATVFNKRVYVRSGDKVFVYGGTGARAVYDGTIAEAWLPYLDANSPTRSKEWSGVDAALTGEWEVRYSLNPNDEAADDLVATLFRTTYAEDRVPSLGNSTHLGLRFRSKGSGAAKLSAVVAHYLGDDDED